MSNYFNLRKIAENKSDPFAPEVVKGPEMPQYPFVVTDSRNPFAGMEFTSFESELDMYTHRALTELPKAYANGIRGIDDYKFFIRKSWIPNRIQLNTRYNQKILDKLSEVVGKNPMVMKNMNPMEKDDMTTKMQNLIYACVKYSTPNAIVPSNLQPLLSEKQK